METVYNLELNVTLDESAKNQNSTKNETSNNDYK